MVGDFRYVVCLSQLPINNARLAYEGGRCRAVKFSRWVRVVWKWLDGPRQKILRTKLKGSNITRKANKTSLILLLCVVIHVYGYKAITHMENRI